MPVAHYRPTAIRLPPAGAGFCAQVTLSRLLETMERGGLGLSLTRLRFRRECTHSKACESRFFVELLLLRTRHLDRDCSYCIADCFVAQRVRGSVFEHFRETFRLQCMRNVV